MATCKASWAFSLPALINREVKGRLKISARAVIAREVAIASTVAARIPFLIRLIFYRTHVLAGIGSNGIAEGDGGKL